MSKLRGVRILLSVCRRKLKLSIYLPWNLFDNMKNDEQKFIFENSLHSGETFFLVGVISFVSLNFYSLANRPRLSCVFIQANK